MFEKIDSIPQNAKTVYAYKTLMMYGTKHMRNAVAMELYLKEVVKEKNYYNPMSDPISILELCRTHSLQFGEYDSDFPSKWYEPDYCDTDVLRDYLPKALELLTKALPEH